MRSTKPKPCLYAVTGRVLSLSGPVLQEFLRAVIDKKAQFRFRASGFSMVPFIRDKDVVTISPFAGPAPRLGDVVAFCHPATQRLVVHRVVAKYFGGFIARGDNTARADGLILAENILGFVGRAEREGRTVRLGSRPERMLLAFLSRVGFLFMLRSWHESLIGFLFKRPGVSKPITSGEVRNGSGK